MSGNPYRGEMAVSLSGTAYIARPDYTAIVAWEQATGRPTAELMVRVMSGIFTLTELTAITHAALTSGGAKLSFEQVGQMIVVEGQTALLNTVGVLLRNALTGGKEPQPGEAQAAETDASLSAAS